MISRLWEKWEELTMGGAEETGPSVRGIGRIRKISREQLLCLAAAILLALLSYVMSVREAGLLGGYRLQRGGHGAAAREYALTVDGLEEEGQQISIRVEPREYSEEEAEQTFAELMEALPLYILGDNADLEHVVSDLHFPKTLRDYPGIRLQFYPDHSGVLDSDGKVTPPDAPQEVNLEVRLRAGEHSAEYILPLTVIPAPSRELSPLQELEEQILEAEAAGRTLEELELPAEYGGRSLHYSVRKDGTWWKILLAGLTAVILLGLKPAQDKRQAEKQRENELLLDYSELVSKLIVYMGAGLTLRNAWLRIAEGYTRQRSLEQTAKREAYEEVCRSALELSKGISEGKVYMDFGHRCGLKSYLKLASILEQNRRTGDGRMETALLLEMQEAFEQRKNTARRLGEEAGTRLMGPLMLSLVTVIIIVVVPAMFKLT